MASPLAMELGFGPRNGTGVEEIHTVIGGGGDVAAIARHPKIKYGRGDRGDPE